ncbi:MAG TPA: hypothetical protein VIC34_05330 [Croceibacterium sp.]|jgi:hypothetical protein
MTEETRLPWEKPFLAALGKAASVKKAATDAGISPGTAYSLRRTNGRFAREWEQACAPAAGRPARRQFTRKVQWKTAFLQALAETSNVTAAAARVNIPTRTVYKLRREDRDFAGKWLAALHEGYDNLEMEVLGHLRDPQPDRKMDVTAALRLLAAHRETVERHRALTEEEDEQATVEALDAFFEGLRQRRLANEALQREADTGDGVA